LKAPEVLEAVQSAGGSLVVRGERIGYVLPDSATWLIREIVNHKKALIELLNKENSAPVMPAGVRLVRWAPKEPPIAIVRIGIVTDVHKFITATLLQLEARLEGKKFLAGNWSLTELVDRLDQVGVELEMESIEREGSEEHDVHP
jgi:hypothetical protein